MYDFPDMRILFRKMGNMRKTLLFAFCLALLFAVGCNSKDSENQGNPQVNTPNMPVPPAQPAASLLAVQGSCKPTADDTAAGTVKLLQGPKTGQFTGCQVLPPNKQNMAAFQARNLTGVTGVPALLAVGPAQAGTAECAIAQPTGVNFYTDQASKEAVILVTKGDKNSGCKIETEHYDAHHWKGKLTANLLPSKSDDAKSAKAVPVKAEWDLYY